jgi:mRNA interferase MazF
MTDNLATILDSEIARVIGHWSDATAIDQALRHTLSL